MIKELSFDNQKIWYDDSLLLEDPKHCFEPEYWKSNDKVIGSARGRGTTWFVKTMKGEAALRHYRRGGLFGKLIEDSYWFSGWENTRSYQELQLLNHLIQAGVNVPKPVAARAIKGTFSYQADLLSEKIPNARDLVSILKERALPPEVYKKIGLEICKMHDAQISHTDLNIHNILIDDQEKVWIIDFDKCSQKHGINWKQGNIERLFRSFQKEKLKHQIHWVPELFSLIRDEFED